MCSCAREGDDRVWPGKKKKKKKEITPFLVMM